MNVILPVTSAGGHIPWPGNVLLMGSLTGTLREPGHGFASDKYVMLGP